MFLTLHEFLKKFDIINMSKDDFVNTFIITYSGNPTLKGIFDDENIHSKAVIKTKEDYRYIHRHKIIDYFYDIVITNRQKYLMDFYKSYFEFKNPFELKWNNVDIYTHCDTKYTENIQNFIFDMQLPCISLQKNDQSRRIIRNLNYLDILHNTIVTNTCKWKTSFWQTFINMYNKLKLEDRFFCKSCLELCLTDKNKNFSINTNVKTLFYHFQQYQPKASILNPYAINWILKNLFDGEKLFTPVLSWSSYLCAFMHSNWNEYVGIDVLQSVCDNTQYLYDYYMNTYPKQVGNKKCKIYCKPSESFLLDKHFMSVYENYFDAVLICPPYYNMEIYPGEMQSITLYKTYNEWLISYWEKTIQLIYHTLKPCKKFGFIINNYKTLGNVHYDLINDLNKIAIKYFKFINAYNLLNRVSPLRVNIKNRTEMLFLYEKK